MDQMIVGLYSVMAICFSNIPTSEKLTRQKNISIDKRFWAVSWISNIISSENGIINWIYPGKAFPTIRKIKIANVFLLVKPL